ncbi:MAG: hypothetical protein JXQ90_18985 [Cyclobacteriaceae bacterium]
MTFGKKHGYFKERRVRHETNERIDYQIFEENIGLFKMLKNVGFSMEIKSLAQRQVKLVFTFYQDAKGLGHLLQPVIKRQQRRGNVAGLNSLKAYIEKRSNHN